MKELFYGELKTDKYIRETFFTDYSYIGTMIEVGAGPPEFYSMSKHFRDNGWRCICIDPNPEFVKQHYELNNEIYDIACSNEEKYSTFNIVNMESMAGQNNGISYSSLKVKYDYNNDNEKYHVTEIPVRVRKLDSLLEELNIENIDFLSIDTEGWEIEVLMGFNIKKYAPRVILLENFLYLDSYVEYMMENGYKLNQKIDYNYIFQKIDDDTDTKILPFIIDFDVNNNKILIYYQSIINASVFIYDCDLIDNIKLIYYGTAYFNNSTLWFSSSIKELKDLDNIKIEIKYKNKTINEEYFQKKFIKIKNNNII